MEGGEGGYITYTVSVLSKLVLETFGYGNPKNISTWLQWYVHVASSPGHSHFFNVAPLKPWEWPGDEANVHVQWYRIINDVPTTLSCFNIFPPICCSVSCYGNQREET